MIKIRLFVVFFLIAGLSFSAMATRIRTCFTPGENCTSLIVDKISAAKRTINVQAYGFTSQPIVDALIQAKNRGVKVFVLLDKSNTSSDYSKADLLYKNHIPFLVDSIPAIAHNKVMIIDDGTVITGSFNFTESAQERNAENVLVITDNQDVARAYSNNFRKRQRASVTLKTYCNQSDGCNKDKWSGEVIRTVKTPPARG